jgi:hypothetical protein
MAKPKYTTFTGVKAEEISTKLAEHLPPEAFKGVPGGADLTDINTGFMIERVTAVFGPRGLGWNLLYDPASLAVGEGNRPIARLDATFSYALWNDKDERCDCLIQVSGVNQNDAKYVEEGARTSAIGAALKWLCFQNDVYKGQYDHHDAAREKQGSNAPATNGAARTNGAPRTNGAAAATPPAAKTWTPDTAGAVKTPKGATIGQLTTDQLAQLVASVDTQRLENKTISPELESAYSAAKFLHTHRTQALPQAA